MEATAQFQEYKFQGSSRWALFSLSGNHEGEPIIVATQDWCIESDGDEDGNSFPSAEWSALRMGDLITEVSDDMQDAYLDAIREEILRMANAGWR